MKKTAIKKQKTPDKIDLLADAFRADRWISSSHYHCKNCGRTVEFLTRIKWDVRDGVKAIGICNPCALIMVESEKRGAWWTSIQKMKPKKTWSLFG